MVAAHRGRRVGHDGFRRVLQRGEAEIGQEPKHENGRHRAQPRCRDAQQAQEHGPASAGQRVVKAAAVGLDEGQRLAVERGRLLPGVAAEIEKPNRAVDRPRHRLISQKFQQPAFGRQERQVHLHGPIDGVQAAQCIAAARAVGSLNVGIPQRGPPVVDGPCQIGRCRNAFGHADFQRQVD